MITSLFWTMIAATVMSMARSIGPHVPHIFLDGQDFHLSKNLSGTGYADKNKRLNTNNQTDHLNTNQHTQNFATSHHTISISTTDCSNKSTFNFTLAVEKGREFQTEFCFRTCTDNPSVENSDDILGCSSSRPVCAMCKCDSGCWFYGDCCDLMDNGGAYSEEDQSEASLQRHHCFPTSLNSAVYVVDSCPQTNISIRASLEQDINIDPFSVNLRQIANLNTDANLEQYVNVNPDRSSHHGIKNPDESVFLAQHIDFQLKCNTCLSTPEQASLVTSHTSGITYCNHYCLSCNEGRPVQKYDFRWSKEKLCKVETGVNSATNDRSDTNVFSNNITVPSLDLSTICKITFIKPDGVIARDCDPKLTYPVIESCPSVAENNEMCSVSSETLREIEKLCSDYYAPVYTEDAVYRNIFCYMCQGHEPETCQDIRTHDDSVNEDISLSLAILTLLSRPADHQQSGESASHGQEVVEQDIKENTLTCKHGYWKDKGKGTCLEVGCGPGRYLVGDLTGPDAFCQRNASESDNSIYKLNLGWYIPEMNEASLLYEKSSSDSSNPEGFDTSSRYRKHSAIRRVYHKDSSYSWVEHKASSNKRLENEEIMVRGGYSPKTVKSDVKSLCNKSILAPFFEIGKGSWYYLSRESFTNEATANLHESLSNEEVRQLMHQHIVVTLNVLGITDFYFQIYPPKKTITDTGQRVSPESTPEQLYESQTSFNEPIDSSGALLYFKLKPGKDRIAFENDLLRRFVGLKNFTCDKKTTLVEMTLTSSHEIYIDPQRLVYRSDPLNGDCCFHLLQERYPALFHDMSCMDYNDNVVSFDAVTLCPHLVFNISDFNMSADSRLERSDLNISLGISEYVLRAEKVDICIKTLENPIAVHAKTISLLVYYEIVITIGSISLSLTCLALAFVTYTLFPALRSLPGKNNMIMIIWLFVAQVMFLLNHVPPKQTAACAITGVLLHYSWLSTVAWTCVCSFHMYNVFVVRRAAQSPIKSHRFYMTAYLLTSNLAAAVVVCAVVCTSLYISGGKSTGYGGSVCYLNSTVLIGVAFVLPLSLVLFVNALFFSRTIYTISRFEDVKRYTGREKRNVHIYLRLSSLTGLCWCLALLAEIPGLHSVRCISVLVNGCQGVTLFVSFVCNKRVARMWSHLFTSKRKGRGLMRNSTDSSKQQTLSTSL